MPRVDREAAVRLRGTLDHLEGRVERVDVHVERHELVDDRRRGVTRRVLAQLAERVGQLAEITRRARDVPDLDVMGVEGRRRLEQQPPTLIGLGAQRIAGRHEEVGEELELEVAQPGIVEDLLHLPQRPRLELVLDVRVP